MKIGRRRFLAGSVTTALAARSVRVAVAGPATVKAQATPKGGDAPLATWAEVRDQFLLGRDYVHMALMLFASHPRPVREAI
jgi:hypothetical protein